MSDTIEFDPEYEFCYGDELVFSIASDQNALVSLLAQKLESDYSEYLSNCEDVKKTLSIMPKDFEPDNSFRAEHFVRDQRMKGFALPETKVRREQLRADIKKLRRELLALSEALDHVPEVCR